MLHHSACCTIHLELNLPCRTPRSSQGRSDLLTRSTAVLKLLPALAAAAADAADSCAAAEAAGSSVAAGEAVSTVGPEVRGTEQLVLEVGQMLVQLVAGGCASFNA